jgi:hypothetical protein
LEVEGEAGVVVAAAGENKESDATPVAFTVAILGFTGQARCSGIHAVDVTVCVRGYHLRTRAGVEGSGSFWRVL